MTVTRIEAYGTQRGARVCDLNLNFRLSGGGRGAEAEVQALARRFAAIATVTDRAPSGPVILEHALLQELRALTRHPWKQAGLEDVAQLARGHPRRDSAPESRRRRSARRGLP